MRGDKLLYYKDCFDFIATLPNNSIDLVITDPPYEVSATNKGGSINNIKKLRDSLQDLVVSDINKGYDIPKFAELIIPKLKRINLYFFCNKVQIPKYFNEYVDKRKCKFDIITYIKQNALPTYSNKYLSDTEYCLHFYKSDGNGCINHPENYDDAKTYYLGYINHKDKKLYKHPTTKPLSLVEKLIRNSSNEGDIVFDPFMGSGTTAVACIYNNRKWIGCENNETYFNIANQRIGEAMENKGE